MQDSPAMEDTVLSLWQPGMLPSTDPDGRSSLHVMLNGEVQSIAPTQHSCPSPCVPVSQPCNSIAPFCLQNHWFRADCSKILPMAERG